MEGAEVWIGLPPEQHFEKMAGVMGEPVHIGIARLEPAGEEIKRERESVDLSACSKVRVQNI